MLQESVRLRGAPQHPTIPSNVDNDDPQRQYLLLELRIPYFCRRKAQISDAPPTTIIATPSYRIPTIDISILFR
jgi:hypothetical protein